MQPAHSSFTYSAGRLNRRWLSAMEQTELLHLAALTPTLTQRREHLPHTPVWVKGLLLHWWAPIRQAWLGLLPTLLSCFVFQHQQCHHYDRLILLKSLKQLARISRYGSNISGKDTNQALCVVPSILPELLPLQQGDIFNFGTGAFHSKCPFT